MTPARSFRRLVMRTCFCDRAPSVMPQRSVLSTRRQTSGTGWVGRADRRTRPKLPRTSNALPAPGVQEHGLCCGSSTVRPIGWWGRERPHLRTPDRGGLVLPAGVRARPRSCDTLRSAGGPLGVRGAGDRTDRSSGVVRDGGRRPSPRIAIASRGRFRVAPLETRGASGLVPGFRQPPGWSGRGLPA